MRTLKEDQIPQLLKEKKVKPVDIFKTGGKTEKAPLEIDWDKRQADAIVLIGEILSKGIRENIGQGKNSLSVFEGLIKTIESVMEDYSKILKESLKAPDTEQDRISGDSIFTVILRGGSNLLLQTL